MQMKKYLSVLFSSLAVISTTTFASTNLVNSSADIVSLRTQCGSTQDCAESMHDLLSWVWNTRRPNALEPLLVNIGPGTFLVENPATGAGEMLCDNGGYVTFRGAGRGTTTLTGPGVGIKVGFLNEGAAVKIRNCTQLAFEDMTIKGELDLESNAYAVGWEGGGSSTWSNMELIAAYYPWVDVCATGSSAIGSHTWFGSTFISHGQGVLNVGYKSNCGISEIHGSNIFVTKTILGNTNWSMIGVEAGAKGQIALYGSSVRVIVPATADPGIVFSNQQIANPPQYGQGGLLSLDGGIIHMHGGIVSVRHERNDVTSSIFGARAVGAGSMVHTPDTAYGMKAAGSGTIARVMNSGGMVMAPFQWQEGENPPNITSVNGADTFVETDCNSTGSCINVPLTQQQPHMMIYSSNCVTGGPWFDSATHKCRM